MEPIHFPEETKTLGKPAGWADEDCGPLPVFNDGVQSISLWKMSWRERFSALIFGRIWLRVVFGYTQPPVLLEAKRNIFK